MSFSLHPPILASIGFAVLCAVELQAAVSGTIPIEAPEPPQGFPSRQAVMTAILKKELPLVAPPSTLPSRIKELKDIEYGMGKDRALKLDLYLPAKSDPRKPSLLFIHGGGWSGGSRDVYKPYTVEFAKRGFVAATASYRLSGEAPFPAAVRDTKCAIRWMRANADQFGINPERIAAIGGSAGGHLSMMLGYSPHVSQLEGNGGHADQSSAVQAVVNFYGPVDLTTKMGQESDLVRRFLNGNRYTENPTIYREASPLFHLGKDSPPTLIIHGTLDETVKIQQGDRLAEKLEQLKVPYAYARIEGWPHSLDAARTMNAYCVSVVESFLQQVFEFAPSSFYSKQQ